MLQNSWIPVNHGETWTEFLAPSWEHLGTESARHSCLSLSASQINKEKKVKIMCVFH